ncbi:MAG: GNAT family N-acetyltransferase [Oscillospiraceae bacterium]|jgi:predicted N-acetyltransferase YhbS
MAAIYYKDVFTEEDYLRVGASVGWPAAEREQVANGLKNSVHLVSAVDAANDSVVGIARCVGDGGMVAVLVDVAVLPDYQGKGIGSALVRLLLEKIKEDLHPGQKVMISLIAAHGREGFYRRFGFAASPDENYGSNMYLWYFR